MDYENGETLLLRWRCQEHLEDAVRYRLLIDTYGLVDVKFKFGVTIAYI